MVGSNRFLALFRARINLPIVCGFSCCLTWFLVALRALILLQGASDPYILHVPFYLCMTGTATATLLFGGIFHIRLSSVLKLSAMRYLPALSVTITTLILLVAFLLEAVFAGILGACAGIGFGIFFFQWRKLWIALEFKGIVFDAVASWFLCTALFFLIVNLNQIIGAIATALLPLISLFLLLYAERTLEPVPPFGKKTDRVPYSMIVRLSCLGFVFSFINEYVRLSNIQRSTLSSEPLSSSLTVNALSLALLLIVVVLSIILPSYKNNDIRFEVPYRLLLILSVMGVLFLLLHENPSIVSYAVNMASYLCLGITLWAASIGLCRKHPLSGMTIFGVVQACWMAGPLISAQLNHELYEASLLPDTPFIVICGVCSLLLVYCFVFRETDIAKTTIEGRTTGFLERCAQVSWRYHLTDRESEVLIHFAKGRNIAWIQEELCLSKSTVSTHRQHIYEKLGIHTKQELIDLVENMDES